MENNKILDMRNNKILTRQPKHTPRGAFTQPRGAFDSFQRTPSGFKLGLEHEEKVSQTTQQ